MLDIATALREFPDGTGSPFRPCGVFLHPGGDDRDDEFKSLAVGVIDSLIHPHPDIDPKTTIIRDFKPQSCRGRGESEHTVHAITLLAGTGHMLIRGLTPGIKVLLGIVANAAGIARAEDIASALHWMIDERVDAIALPLGSRETHLGVIAALDRAAANGVPIFAAAGNVFPEPVLFPASYPTTITVGAADRTGALLASTARYPAPDAIAPGHLIESAVSNRATRALSGTSVATIVACGLYARHLAERTRIATTNCNYQLRQS